MTSTAAWSGALGITPVIAERGEEHGSGLDRHPVGGRAHDRLPFAA